MKNVLGLFFFGMAAVYAQVDQTSDIFAAIAQVNKEMDSPAARAQQAEYQQVATASQAQERADSIARVARAAGRYTATIISAQPSGSFAIGNTFQFEITTDVRTTDTFGSAIILGEDCAIIVPQKSGMGFVLRNDPPLEIAAVQVSSEGIPTGIELSLGANPQRNAVATVVRTAP